MRYYDIDKLNAYSSMLEKHYTEKYIDTDLACHIYDFLNGDSNTLPAYSTFYNVIDSVNIGDKISEGYGVTISLAKEDDKTKPYIIIEMEINIDKSKIRFDRITSEKHIGILIYGRRHIILNESIEKNIKIKEYPIIDKKRIKFLQDYLKKFDLNKRKQKSK